VNAVTSTIPNLPVSNGLGAVEFSKAAFGAVVDFRFEDEGGSIFAALTIDGARLFVAAKAPAYGNLSPGPLGNTSVRIRRGCRRGRSRRGPPKYRLCGRKSKDHGWATGAVWLVLGG